MCHVRTDHGPSLVRWKPRRCVVYRLIKSIGSFPTLARQLPQIIASLFWRDHQSQSTCIRSDHHVFGQSSFQTQTWHAESAVLIVMMCVGAIKPGFGHSPGELARLPIVDLRFDGRLTSEVEQSVTIAWHN